MASTNTDFRLQVGYLQHPKTKKLRLRLGADGVLAHIQILEFTAVNKPDGILVNMSAEDILLASNYSGDGDFVAELVAIRLLDLVDGVYRVHDWETHNPWASGAARRSESASNASKARWAKVRGEDGDGSESNADSCGAHCDTDKSALRNDTPSNAPFLSVSESYPYPNPDPNQDPHTPTPPADAAPLGVGEDDTLSSLESHAPSTKAERAAIAASAKNASALFIDAFRSVNDGADPDIPARYHRQLGEKLKSQGRDKFVSALRGFFVSDWAKGEGFNVATFVNQPLDRWLGQSKARTQAPDLMPPSAADHVLSTLTRPYVSRRETAH